MRRGQFPLFPLQGDISKLVSGTAFAQLLGVATAPLLTRLYSPDDFGVFAIFAAVAMVVGAISCLRYEQAIVLAADHEEAARLCVLSLSLAGFVALSTASLTALWLSSATNPLSTTTPRDVIWLLPIAVLMSGAQLALNNWAVWHKRFGLIAMSSALAALVATIVKLVFPLVLFQSATGLVLGMVFGQALAVAVLLTEAARRIRFAVTAGQRWRGLLHRLARHRNFPLYNVWAVLLNSLSLHMPILLLSAFFATATTGQYSVAHRILTLPMALLGSAIGQVFYRRAVLAKRKEALGILTERTFLLLLQIGLPAFGCLMVIGPEAFALAFGPQWSEAGEYARLLSPWVLLVFVGSPLVSIINIERKQHVGLAFEATLFAARAAALLVGGWSDNPRVAVGLFSGVGTIMWSGLCLYLLRLGDGVRHGTSADVLRTAIRASFCVGPPVGMLAVWPEAVLERIVITVVLLAVYYVDVFRSARVWSRVAEGEHGPDGNESSMES